MHKKHIFKSLMSVFFAAILLYFVTNNFLTDKHYEIIESITLYEFLLSGFFLFTSFFLSGIQLRNIYSKTNILKLSWFDTFSLPITMNFWGYIIPFQGSFIYSMFFLKSKYDSSIPSLTGIYLCVLSLSLSLGGGSGVLFFFLSKNVNELFFVLNLILFINPFLVWFSSFVFKRFDSKFYFMGKYKSIVETFSNTILSYFKQPKIIFQTVFIDLLIVLCFATWSYWLTEKYEMNIPFFVMFITGFLIKLTLLFKVTPGNLGVVQFGVGGIFVMLGYDYSIGVFISIYQLVCLVLLSFPVAIILSLFNIKLFSNFLKRSFIKK